MEDRKSTRSGRSGQGVIEEHVRELLHDEREADAEREGPSEERVAEEGARFERDEDAPG